MPPEGLGSQYRTLWLRWFIGLTLGAGVTAVYPLSLLSPLPKNSALVGWLISFIVCGGSGFLAFWSLSRSLRAALIVMFGGMIVRLALVAAAVFVAITVAKVHIKAFLIGLLGAYTVYHALELVILSRYRPGPNEQPAAPTGEAV